MEKTLQNQALEYHLGGKVAISVTKPCVNSKDLSLAYSPGVAEPCKEIQRDENLVYKYTSKSNLVAVISNGTAVLGLGDIGAAASKPVMEGKAVLFKKFANVDAFDIEINERDPKKIVEICKAISVGFGGINLEDIKAPECFEIERELQKAVNIPIMHDDQHGTAMITTAGLINALEISKKDIKNIRVVVNGSGASGIACAKMYKELGVQNIIMLDSKGVIHDGRNDLNEQKKEFAIHTDLRTLQDAMNGADMFLGLSKGGVVSKDMVKSMAKNPIIFALANPVPEIFPHEIMEVRDDAMIGTGRSDFPNQINNVLGFPYIFRGALDVHARKITPNMKMAAAKALAMLAREPVSKEILDLTKNPNLTFGKDYIIPNPFDKRVLFAVAPEVAKAAFNDGVAGINNFDEKEYLESLRINFLEKHL
ncbi:NADP-dependent malic enzyme (NADP-me) [Campylobacter sputorum subsp. bubulus]|uniref:NADP-dependent malic enzyme (NADP-me) n=1 Tax=Campylobacter sputorum subsp. sputorum TaxID=32024 RepID=A0A381DLV7_9BACT|nr:malic enzyme-like NAD(P)-binding protein [Campylobacter sputorum]ASM34791.1 malate oxidoreductase [Campylobacter sputorum aubsp. sputorum RM3237]ASM36455.1 malate oxidoreductase [Campylobacter sputorum bv. faecalis CCUG 20703]KAB0581653.1 malate dehydrogenase [Campylobacter sputorum subsp. sputorum]QEL04984.1 malate oxidoreductase [Campylobacter sputorum subsp. sputorum]SUX10127.1 NADP-dependent malic enzyme (NADP-me) [Campylobacter sputorum subsp. bubulus]